MQIKSKSLAGFTVGKLKDFEHPEKTLFKAIPYLPEKWWMSAGTALGLYRDGDFIKEDTDIDIGVLGGEIVEIPTLIEFRQTFWRGKIMQQAFKDKNNMILDVFHYYDDVIPNKLFAASELGYIVKPLFNIKELDTKYGKLPFLNPIEDYLTDRYGDWETPTGFKGNHIREDDLML